MDAICIDWWLIHVSDNPLQYLPQLSARERALHGVVRYLIICRVSLRLGPAHVLEAHAVTRSKLLSRDVKLSAFEHPVAVAVWQLM